MMVDKKHTLNTLLIIPAFDGARAVIYPVTPGESGIALPCVTMLM